MAVTVDSTGITANADGKKIVPAGTIVGGKNGSVLLDGNEVVVNKNSKNASSSTAETNGAEGILLNDVDVTYGNEAGAMLLHGFIDLKKLPEPPVADDYRRHKKNYLLILKKIKRNLKY